MANIPGLENINWFGMFGNIYYYFKIFLIAIIILVVFVIIFVIMIYNYKVDVYPIFGSGRSGVFSIGRKKINFVKKEKEGNVWKKLFPLGNKVNVEPFDDEFVYPGRRIVVFELGDKWIPGRVIIESDGNDLKSQISPVPSYIRNWQSLQYKKNALEFSEHSFWEENKYFFMVLVTAALCLVMVGITVYFTYKFASPIRQDLGALTSAIRGLSNMGGAPIG